MSALDWGTFFFLGFGLPFTLYVVAQTWALIILRGGARWIVSLPLLPMAWVAYVTAEAWEAQSNIWPILMILASPLALAYVVVVAIVARQKARPTR